MKQLKMKQLILILTGVLLFLTPDITAQTSKSMGSLTFKISGFAEDEGQVLVQLFRKEDKVPANPFRLVIAKITNREAIVVVDSLLYGEYGAIVVHDKNGNGHIDHRWGIPAEPLGYTNNWKLSYFSGMPTFNKLKFTFNESTSQYSIKMKE